MKKRGPWVKGAVAAAVLALVCNGMAWLLFLEFIPVRPSRVWGFAGVGGWSLVVAVVLGAVAAFREPAKGGWWGILGLLALLVPSCLMTALLSGPPGESVDFQWSAAPLVPMSRVVRAAREYADEHGTFPHALDDLVAAGRVKAEELRDPGTGEVFEYHGEGLSAEGAARVMVVNTREVVERQGRWAGFGDGHCEMVPNGEWGQRVAASEGERVKVTTRAATSAP